MESGYLEYEYIAPTPFGFGYHQNNATCVVNDPSIHAVVR